MSSLAEHYRILGVSFGAGIADVTSSYRRLCRIYHPDISGDPESEELMKKINVAYTVLREKLKREAAFRERSSYQRYGRRYSGESRSDERARSAWSSASNADAKKAAAAEEKEASAVLSAYFSALSTFDYSGAYYYLSSYDKRHISPDSFVQWRKSVARLHPLREFKISGGLPVVSVNWGGGKTQYARKFRVSIAEEEKEGEERSSDVVEKLVINDNGQWRVFLGYKGVGELTRSFDERFETLKDKAVSVRWQEYLTGLYAEYDMLNLTGMKRAVSRELYRKKRFGGTLTFAVIEIKSTGIKGEGQDELRRSAAKTLCEALRETDIAAYAGDGVFALLLVELRKKNAEHIISRIIDKIRNDAGKALASRAEIKFEFDTWSGNRALSIDLLNVVLRKFKKKF